MCLAFCWAQLLSETAHGATVALLGSTATPALSEASSRLRGELSALRFQVILLREPTLVELAGLERHAWLERTAQARNIDAALEVVGETAPRAVDVWIFQRSPPRTQVSRVVPDPGTPDQAGTLAIRAIEVLRSYSLETDLAARARAGEAPPTADPVPADRASPAAAPSVERAGIELGAGLLTTLDGVGPALSPVLRVDWRAHPTFLVHATLSGFGTRPSLSAPAGTVRVDQTYAALGSCYCPAASRALAPYLTLAAGAMRTSLVGDAASPAAGHSISQWSLLLDAGIGARLRLPGRYYTTLSGHLQLLAPRVAIYVLDEQLASSGRPNLAANLMIGAWL